MTHAVMTVIGSSAVESTRSNLFRFLQRTGWPLVTVLVRLSEPDGVVFDSRRWTIGDRALAEVTSEIGQYIAAGGASVEATVVAHRYDLASSDVTSRFLY
jgi:hypothetical protein